MKRVLKDIASSIFIAILCFYVSYIINGEYLVGDLYAQGLPFLEYFKSHFNIFSDDLIYNWNMGIGDSAYSFIIYYLVSPFNILLLIFKWINTIDFMPIFITIKLCFMIYFSSIYFKKVVGAKYKWIGTIIYALSYNIMVYSSLQVMWLDTFIFLPLVLLGIEKVVNNEKSYLYIGAFFLLIITNYYLAALLIMQIFIYGVIRYIYVHNFKGILKFIGKMIAYSIVSFLLSSFVLIPAVYYTINSAKDGNNITALKNNLDILLEFIRGNVIGSSVSLSSTYVPVISMISTLAFLIFSKNKKILLYCIPILLLLLGVYSGKVNYILSLGYQTSGGDFRYNLLFNIYFAFILCTALKELKSYTGKAMALIIVISALYVVSIFMPGGSKYAKDVFTYITTAFVMMNIIVLYLLWVYKRSKAKNIKYQNVLIKGITLILLAEMTLCSIGITQDRKFTLKEHVKNRYAVLEYVGEKYSEDGRVEVGDTNASTNAYLSKNTPGVEGYHSLMAESYRLIGQVFQNTNTKKVINRLGGREIITRFTGVKYYVSKYDYCPYIESKLIDTYDDYYIFSIDNNKIKYFKNTVNSLPDSMAERDTVLYNNLYIYRGKEPLYNTYLDNISTYDIKGNEFNVEFDGEYYLNTKNNTEDYLVGITINGVNLEGRHYFSNVVKPNKGGLEIYIGNLKKGDNIKFDFDLGDSPSLSKIDSNYIKSSLDNMNVVENQNVKAEGNSFSADFSIKEKGYVVLPVVYDKSWKITNNGKSINPISANGGFIAFNLEEGEHNIEMRYVPYSVYLGIGVSTVTIFALLSFYAITRKQKRNS